MYLKNSVIPNGIRQKKLPTFKNIMKIFKYTRRMSEKERGKTAVVSAPNFGEKKIGSLKFER